VAFAANVFSPLSILALEAVIGKRFLISTLAAEANVSRGGRGHKFIIRAEVRVRRLVAGEDGAVRFPKLRPEMLAGREVAADNWRLSPRGGARGRECQNQKHLVPYMADIDIDRNLEENNGGDELDLVDGADAAWKLGIPVKSRDGLASAVPAKRFLELRLIDGEEENGQHAGDQGRQVPIQDEQALSRPAEPTRPPVEEDQASRPPPLSPSPEIPSWWAPPPSPPSKKAFPAIPPELELPPNARGASFGAGFIAAGLACVGLLVAGALIGRSTLVVKSEVPSSNHLPATVAVPALGLQAESSAEAPYWSIGDTKQAVQGIESEPELVSQDGLVWHFNLSDRVQFDGKSGLVVGWRNSTGKLHVTMGPRSTVPSQEKGASFRTGATMPDVLRTLGMPQQVWWEPAGDRQSWEYPGGVNGKDIRRVQFTNGLVEWVFGNDGVQIVGPVTFDGVDADANRVTGKESRPSPQSAKPLEGNEIARIAKKPASNRSPQWGDFPANTARGTVTMVSQEESGLFCAARFQRNMSGVQVERIPVFRLSYEQRELPRFIGEMEGLVINGIVIAGRCQGFQPENGDLVAVPIGELSHSR
jgi:hypothetical protein